MQKHVYNLYAYTLFTSFTSRPITPSLHKNLLKLNLGLLNITVCHFTVFTCTSIGILAQPRKIQYQVRLSKNVAKRAICLSGWHCQEDDLLSPDLSSPTVQ